MDGKPKPPWNSRERRWNLRWWQILLLVLALGLLCAIIDSIVTAYQLGLPLFP